LTRGLYEKGYDRQEILDLYRFIDWILALPEAVEREFWQELQVFEEERKVTYVTNAERFGIEKGVIQGERSLIFRLLSRRVGVLSSEVRSASATTVVRRLNPYPWNNWSCWVRRYWIFLLRLIWMSGCVHASIALANRTRNTST
jgi:hypothetical protein